MTLCRFIFLFSSPFLSVKGRERRLSFPFTISFELSILGLKVTEDIDSFSAVCDILNSHSINESEANVWMRSEILDAHNTTIRFISGAASSRKVSKEAQNVGMQRASLPERRPKVITASAHGSTEDHEALWPAQTSSHGQQESPLGPLVAATSTPTTITMTAVGGLASQGSNFARGSQSDTSRVFTTLTREAESHSGIRMHTPALNSSPAGQRELQNNASRRSSNFSPMSFHYKGFSSAWTQICRNLLPPNKTLILTN